MARFSRIVRFSLFAVVRRGFEPPRLYLAGGRRYRLIYRPSKNGQKVKTLESSKEGKDLLNSIQY